MRQTLRLMKKLRTELLDAKLPWILSIATLLSGCAGLKKFPEDRLWEFDAKDRVCAEYKITDYEHFKYVWLRDVPLNQCPSIFGFTTKAIPKVLDWAQDSVEYGRTHCR